MPGFEPRAAGCEASTLSIVLCGPPPPHLLVFVYLSLTSSALAHSATAPGEFKSVFSYSTVAVVVEA